MVLLTIIGIVTTVLIIIAIIWFISTYNKFVKIRNTIDNAWAQIDVQTKKRFDLVPNLVETVKGYAAHEKSVFTDVTEARAATSKAGTVEGKAQAENMLTGALKSLFAVSENYPDLKANQNFLMLQEELSGIENKIAYARQFYNDVVMKWNQQREVFPSVLIANMFGFKPREYFEIEEAAREVVKVEF